jgi:glycosyltransferase involved in cell wall biosynthesis
MSLTPLVSIGLPVKNGFGNYSKNEINISNSLKALINQSYKNIEIIVSNNCSIDNTEKFLNKMSKIDSRIKVFHQKKEISWAKNFRFVLNKSKGKYFKWNAADDMISKDYIINNVKFLENNLNYISSSSKFLYENNPNKFYSFDLVGSVYSRIKGFFKVRHISHNILFSLVRRKNMMKTIDISKDYWAIDWMFDLDLLFQGNFKIIDEGYAKFGMKGMSRQSNFINREIYLKKKIYYIFPFYELMKRVFLKTILNNNINIFQKISIYFSLININIYFIKLHRLKIIKKIFSN